MTASLASWTDGCVVPATLMRGGTSKCWVFESDALEQTGARVDDILAAAFGAGDQHQIDGVGGATSVTSKALIMRPATLRGGISEVDYTFAQVGIGRTEVEWGSNCGNCATAAGLYAVQHHLLRLQHDVTHVRLRNTNTGTVLIASIPTPGAAPVESGGATVPGVAQVGVPVELTFVNPVGGSTGCLLPTGLPLDEIELTDQTPLRAHATLIDSGAPAVLVRATDLGLDGEISLDRLTASLGVLRAIRLVAAVQMGLRSHGDPEVLSVPKVGVVAPAVDYQSTAGEKIAAADYDVSVRMVSMLAPHPSIGLTSAVAVATAAGLDGSVVNAVVAGHRGDPGLTPSSLRIGTAAGVVTVYVDSAPDGHVTGVRLPRAARRIAEAHIFAPASMPPPPRLLRDREVGDHECS